MMQLKEISQEGDGTKEVIHFNDKRDFLKLAAKIGEIARESLDPKLINKLGGLAQEMARESLTLQSKMYTMFMDERICNNPIEIELSSIPESNDEHILEISKKILVTAVQNCSVPKD